MDYTITHAANSIGIVQEICDQFDKETSNKKGSGKQTIPSSRKNIPLIVEFGEGTCSFNETSRIW